MRDYIEINLRGLTERHRNSISKVLKEALNTIPDEDNKQALEDLNAFIED